MSQTSADGNVPKLGKPVDAKQSGTAKTNLAVKFLLLLLILAVLALAAGGVFLFQQQRHGSEASQTIFNQIQLDQQQLQESLQQLDSRISAQRSAEQENLATLQGQLENLTTQQTQQAQQLHRMSTTDRSDWKLAEAEYLLRLANHRLLIAKETSGAAALLQAADDVIRDLDDMGLFKVREAIGIDLAAVRAVPDVDITGTYSRIHGLATQVDQLPLVINAKQSVHSDEQPDNVDPNANFTTRAWQRLQNAWQKMKQVLSIRSYDYRSEPLLPPEQYFYLRQNLKLQFDQAQAALLTRNEQLFQSSLANASEWLSRYYQRNAPAVKAVLDTLQDLHHLNLQQALPDISGSLRALQHYQKSRHDESSKQVEVKKETSQPDGSHAP